MNKFFRIAALAGVLLPQLCGAADPELTVTASPREFRAGGATRVSITLGKELRDGGFALPKVNGAEWRTDRVARSTSVRIVNDKSSRSETYTLPLAASIPGELVIPSFEVRFADGTTARSEPVKLTVLAPGETAKTAAPELSGRIVVAADRKHFYVGEGVPVALELTVPGGMRLADLGFPRLECDGPMVMPDVAGGDSRHPHYSAPVEGTRETPGGRAATVTFSTQPRFPRPGDFTLTATETAAVTLPRAAGDPDDPFGDPFFSGRFFGETASPVQVKYPALKLKILPLPPVPAGALRLGMCANCRLEAGISAASARTGEPLELEIAVRGTAEPAEITPPALKIPGFRVYPPAEKRSPDGGRIIRYAIVPLAPGEHRIELKFAVFDPAKERWKSVAVTRRIAVTGAATVPSAPPPAADGGLPPLRSGAEVSAMPLKTGLVKGGIAFGVLALLALTIELVRRMRKKPDPAQAGRRKQVAELIRRTKNGDAPDAILRDGGTAALARVFELPEDAPPREIAEKIVDAELRRTLEELEYNSFAPEAERRVRPISAAARRRLAKLLKRALVFALFAAAFTARGADPDCGESPKKRLDPAWLYNAGMTFRRDGDLPRARKALETAHLLAPRDKRILAALETTENDLAVPPSDRTLRDFFRPDEYLTAAGVLFGLALSGFAVLRKRRRRTAFAAAWVLAAFGAVAAALAWSQYGENGPYRTDRAIVVDGKTTLSSLPLEPGGRIVGELDGGAEVVIVEEKGRFVRVRSGKADGWCRRSAAERILPVQFP